MRNEDLAIRQTCVELIARIQPRITRIVFRICVICGSIVPRFNTMETLLIVGRFVLLGSLLIFPQLLGILLYYRLKRAPRWIAVTAAALLPAIVFFWLGPIFLFAGIREAYARDQSGCGMAAAAAGIIFLALTAIQLLVGVVAQLILSVRRRRLFSA